MRSEYPRTQEQSQGDWVVWNDLRELPRRTRTLQSIGAYGNAVFDLAGDSASPPDALYGVRMAAELFHVLGVSPMLGRAILPEEDLPGHADVMILSYGLWMRRFHGDRSVVGRTVTVNGRGCRVIGVMPEGSIFPCAGRPPTHPRRTSNFGRRRCARPPIPRAGLGAVARLRPGVSLDRPARTCRRSAARSPTRFPSPIATVPSP